MWKGCSRVTAAPTRSLRRIEEATEVMRETASAYLRAAKLAVRRRDRRPRVWPPNPATTTEVSTDSASNIANWLRLGLQPSKGYENQW
jgi:hypothetical protein